MFTINENEYHEIADAIFNNCCRFCSPFLCSESDCDIHEIYKLLSAHLEKDDFEYNDFEYDEELPFN